MKVNREKDALIIVDVQNDFLPGGALAVEDGDKVVEPINRIKPLFREVFATKDWHPADHASFQAQGGPWPPHCVQGTKGAEHPPDLDAAGFRLVKVGYGREMEGYSGFEHSDLTENLKGKQRLFVTGIATDYCVKATVLDALKLGFEVTLVTDAVKPVNVNPGDGDKAIAEMAAAGAKLAEAGDLG